MPAKKEGSDRQILIHAIMDWMKHHPGQQVPSYKEITQGLRVSNLLTCFTQIKRSAFVALQKAGYILKFSQEPNTCNAMIDGFEAPNGIGEKNVGKLIPQSESPAHYHETMQYDSIHLPKAKHSAIFAINKANVQANDLKAIGRSLYNLGRMNSCKSVNIQIKITEGGPENGSN
ncbi:MAG: hypothetical protein N2376_00805 [Clostridia bacterium]|nr:hypothetical protein [Clostridia bacterium]